MSKETGKTTMPQAILSKKPYRDDLPYSEAQVQKLNLEFRKLQKECNLNNKKKACFDFVRYEQEKVKELLKQEMTSVDEDKVSMDGINDEVVDLLLTKGMIDLDKVICLHVFSIQQPKKCQENKKVDQQPQDLKINLLTRYSNYLPCYLMENEDSTVNCNCWKGDKKDVLSSGRAVNLHLQVNSQAESIIHTVISVLENLNPAKLNELSRRAHNAEEVSNIIGNPENLTFVSSLLHSNFIRKNRNVRSEVCSLMVGKTDTIQDVSKFKKNIVFRLDVPASLVNVYSDIGKYGNEPMKIKTEVESSFEELLKIKKHVGSNVSVIPGYKLLQKGSSSGGIAVLDQYGTSISYIAAGSSESSGNGDLTIFMQSPKISDHEYVIEKMSEMEGDKIILAKPNNRLEETCLKIAKRHMKTDKKVLQDDVDHQEIKEDILKRLSNEERLAVAEKAAELKNVEINAEGEVKSVPLVDILRGTVDRHSLLKLVREASDREKEVMFKPTNQGGMGLGELLMDKNELSLLSRLDNIPDVETVAVVEKECLSRAPKKLNVGLSSLFGTMKIEQEVAKKEVERSCGAFIRRLKRK